MSCGSVKKWERGGGGCAVVYRGREGEDDGMEVGWNAC